MLSHNSFFNLVDYVADVFVGDPGASGQADASGEEAFGHAVGIGEVIFVDELLMHGIPEGRLSMLAASRAMRRSSTLSLGRQSVTAVTAAWHRGM